MEIIQKRFEIYKKIFIDFLLKYGSDRIRRYIFFKYIKHYNFEIRKGVYFDNLNKCKIGKNIFINYDCKFYTGYSKEDKNMIFLGENVYIGMNVIFICVSHLIGTEQKRAGKNVYKPIVVEQGSWIGGGEYNSSRSYYRKRMYYRCWKCCN